MGVRNRTTTLRCECLPQPTEDPAPSLQLGPLASEARQRRQFRKGRNRVDWTARVGSWGEALLARGRRRAWHFGEMLGACRNGNLDQIKALVQADRRRAVNVDEAGATPLHRVCSYNHVECGQYLIDNNADVNGLDKYHEAPMKRAAYNGHVDSLVMLLKAGANANYADPTGKMALHHAAEQGRLQCVEALLDNGALVDAEDQHYTTPLLLAAGNGHTTVCRVLLENGTRPPRCVERVRR